MNNNSNPQNKISQVEEAYAALNQKLAELENHRKNLTNETLQKITFNEIERLKNEINK